MVVYKIKEETSLAVAKECIELGKNHYYEVEKKSSHIPYNVNWEIAKVLIEYNLVVIVTVRNDSNELVGYMINLISEDFLTSQVEAKELGIYLKPEVRGSKTFLRLLGHTQQVLLDRNVKTQYIMFKEGHDTGMAERLGYNKTETVYQKIFEV